MTLFGCFQGLMAANDNAAPSAFEKEQVGTLLFFPSFLFPKS